MRSSRESVESALSVCAELIAGDPVLNAQHEDSRARFHGPALALLEAHGTQEERLAASRRHLEWFLLEGEQDVESSARVELLAGRFQEVASYAERDAFQALLHSQTGVFEVTGVRAGEGLWIQDLFSLGEYPLLEPEASDELAVGDLLIGRIFPLGDGLFCISAGASSFRTPALLQALRRDLEQLRGTHRGALRISQLELERMFHSLPASVAQREGEPQYSMPQAEPQPRRDPRAARILACELLGAAGIDEDEIELLFTQMAEVPADPRRVVLGAQDLVGEWLDELAFDSGVDLEAAREALLQAWFEITREQLLERTERAAIQAPGPGSKAPPLAAPAGVSEPGSSDFRAGLETHEQRARAALARFDAARSSGADLSAAFSQLELELGLAPGSSDFEDEDLGLVPPEAERGAALPEGELSPAPDFPGVVGAVIEEFLWEVGEYESLERAQSFACLRSLAESTSQLGLLEELDALALVRHASFWLLREGKLTSAEDAHRELAALKAFAEWCESAQELPLWSAVRPIHALLEEALPRLAGLGHGGTPAKRYEVLAHAENGALELAPLEGGLLVSQLPPEQARRLRIGEFIEGRPKGASFELVCAYPSAARIFLSEE